LFNTGTTIDTVTYHVTQTTPGVHLYPLKTLKLLLSPMADAHFLPTSQSVCNGTNTAISIFFQIYLAQPSPGPIPLAQLILSGASNGAGNLIKPDPFQFGFYNRYGNLQYNTNKQWLPGKQFRM